MKNDIRRFLKCSTILNFVSYSCLALGFSSLYFTPSVLLVFLFYCFVSSARRTTIVSTSLRILIQKLLLKFFETFESFAVHTFHGIGLLAVLYERVVFNELFRLYCSAVTLIPTNCFIWLLRLYLLYLVTHKPLSATHTCTTIELTKQIQNVNEHLCVAV